MSVYRIRWERMVDRALVEDLATAAGLATPPSVGAVRPVLASILEATGGWPYVTKAPSRRAQRDFALRLLGEATAHAIGGGARQVPGFDLAPRRAGMREIRAIPRVEVNSADVSALTAVPGLTPRLARAIVAERLSHGALRSAIDLAERVAGIGPTTARRLAPYLGFLTPEAATASASGHLVVDLPALMSQAPGADDTGRFIGALDRIAMRAAAEHHPHTRYQLPRPADEPSPPDNTSVERIVLLPGRRYYARMQAAIRGAEHRVDVAMFHIAMPREDHPTRRILDALIAAHRRGAQVRVLVDRDRRNDPYHSQVINSLAVHYLAGRGVAVRVDAPQRLLHSKLVVIDDDVTIVGSHNWSAGSYFGFDDLSVDVRSPALAREVRRRFDALWRRGERAVRRGRR